MFDWTQLYVDLLRNASPDVIVQTLNRIMVTGKQKGDKTVVDFARKIFAKIADIFKLKFPSLHTLTKGNPNISYTVNKTDGSLSFELVNLGINLGQFIHHYNVLNPGLFLRDHKIRHQPSSAFI